ncbi:hypothetical protein [Gordonia sp. i37]|uniref:hypothetical protein n=1 Tax=Gordonia sp. i37 TaxID=1961707 RepID=UPI0009AEE1F2|nr:hypothetical protein [Gordonia sp. i37]OPX14316.1 hypothetical protein B1964_15725 [Gordonia sp. i37]
MSAAVTIALVVGAFFAREIIGTAVTVVTAVVIAARRYTPALDPRATADDNESNTAATQYRLVRN